LLDIENNLSSRDGLLNNEGYDDEVTEVDGGNDLSNKISNFQPIYPGRRQSVQPDKEAIPMSPKSTASFATNPKSKFSKIKPVKSNTSAMRELPADKSLNRSMNDKSFQGDKSMNEEGRHLTEQDDVDSLGEHDEEVPDDEKWKDRKCFWQMNEQTRIRWDLFVMVLATWNCFTIPFNAAFRPVIMENIYFEIFNACIDILFMVDVAICFRTSFMNPKTGEEVFDIKVIAKHYLKGRFWVDILASLPLDVIGLLVLSGSGSTVIFEAFGLLKLVRVLRLSRIIMYMNLRDDIKMSLKLVKLVFFLVMYIHCQGCLWHIIVQGNEEWIPPLDYVFVTTEIYDDTVSMKYFNAVYHSTLLLAGNDIGPRGDFQLFFCVATLLICAIINANIFGNLAVLVSALNRKATKFQDKLDTVNTAMKNMKLPEDTQKNVQNYIMSTQSTLDHQQEMDAFLKMISPSLRLEVTKHIFSMIVIKNPLFENNEDLIDYLVRYLNTLLYLPEDIIIKQGETPDNLYFLARGEVMVYIYDENDDERYVTSLKLGSYFGEVGIIKECRRTSTIKSKNYTTCAALSLVNFKDFKNRYPEIVRKMNDEMIKYQDRWKKFLKRTLKYICFLSHDISDIILEDLIYELDTERVETGNYLFKKGYMCDCIYIIIHGEVDIYMENNGRETFIETLSQSCNIGAYSTLQEDDYSFSCKAKTDCTMMTLKYETLDTFRSKYEELDYYLLEYEGFIEDNGAPYCDFLIYRSRGRKFDPIETFISGAKRMKQVLKSYSRNIEFGDILKRVQETIRKDRAKEKKKRKFADDNKSISQTQINGKMIVELKSEMKRMHEIIESQNDMIKTLVNQQPPTNKEFYPNEDMNLEESRVSMKNQVLKPFDSMNNTQNYNKAATQSYAPDYSNQWE
jgi:CRP-like cAMP-binding protein